MANPVDDDRNPSFFVAVHVGAGFHAPSNEIALRSAMKRACLAAASLLRKVSFFVSLSLPLSLFGNRETEGKFSIEVNIMIIFFGD